MPENEITIVDDCSESAESLARYSNAWRRSSPSSNDYVMVKCALQALLGPSAPPSQLCVCEQECTFATSGDRLMVVCRIALSSAPQQSVRDAVAPVGATSLLSPKSYSSLSSSPHRSLSVPPPPLPLVLLSLLERRSLVGLLPSSSPLLPTCNNV